MEQRIQQRVIDLTARTKNSMLSETGISSSLDEEDIKYYLKQVLAEIKSKTKSNNNDS